jgi:predicted nucleic acid-binding protein
LIAIAEGPALWALPVFCLTEFVRVVTHPRVLDSPFTPDEAVEALDALLRSSTLHVINPGARFPSILKALVGDLGLTGNLVFDAQIVAVCREAGVSRLLTEDQDFARFPGFRAESL